MSIPTNPFFYYHRETIDSHERNLKELFDLNFGKDWRIFLSLYYSQQYARHAFHYNNPSLIEKTKFKRGSWGIVIRNAIFGLCSNIMKSYLTNGRKFVEKEIEDNKYRFTWNFEANKPKEIIISDELYNAVHNPVKIEDTVKPEKKPQPEEYGDKINGAEEKINELREKEVAGDITPEELTELKKLKKQVQAWQRELEVLGEKIDIQSKS